MILEAQGMFSTYSPLLIVVVVSVALVAAALYYFITHSKVLHQAVTGAAVNHQAEVGKLAAGLAHEIRNSLHAIRLNLHTVRRIHERQLSLPPEEMTAMIEQSVREIDRIEHLLKQLLGFASPDKPRDEPVEVCSEVREVVGFIHQEMLGSEVQIETRIPRQGILVRTDRGRLCQIMLNLLENARQAMAIGGHITVSIQRRRGRAEIRVSDNGPGIPEADRSRVFDPFFSTKEGGTGLGLAMVKRFVDEAGGEILCENNTPSGTAFRILLPEAKK